MKPENIFLNMNEDKTIKCIFSRVCEFHKFENIK